jgi:Protein of unknown function DUF262
MARRPRPARITQEQIDAAERAIEDLEISVKFLVTDFTVEYLVGKVREQEYFVPGYQRAFVSVLIGLPIPFLFLWQDDDGRLEIVDGSQRLRTLQRFMDGVLILNKLQLLESLNGFKYDNLTKSRQRKFSARVIRGIVLDNSVGEATRTEMFNRINTGGTKANEAEVRRGVLPGPMSDLISECADDLNFIQLTPISERLVALREREEFVVRFFTFLDRAQIENGEVIFPGWKDRPREYIYEYVKNANSRGHEDPAYIEKLRNEFRVMLNFVQSNFPNGFRKGPRANQVPRVRYEAIAVGAGLAIRQRPELALRRIDVGHWIDGAEFQEITTSDSANVRAKLQRRIGYVVERLVAQ